MDIQPQSTQPISDDQELAKVLAGVNADGDDEDTTSGTAMSQIAAPIADGPPPTALPAVDPMAALSSEPVLPPVQPSPTPLPSPTMMPSGTDDLGSVKSDAINELRPLVGKLNLSPEEKFDTYLLLIRSTDDKTLVAPAHEAAKQITDETRKAQALLDIIKEIDFLSNPQQPQ